MLFWVYDLSSLYKLCLEEALSFFFFFACNPVTTNPTCIPLVFSLDFRQIDKTDQFDFPSPPLLSFSSSFSPFMCVLSLAHKRRINYISFNHLNVRYLLHQYSRLPTKPMGREGHLQTPLYFILNYVFKISVLNYSLQVLTTQLSLTTDCKWSLDKSLRLNT